MGIGNAKNPPSKWEATSHQKCYHMLYEQEGLGVKESQDVLLQAKLGQWAYAVVKGEAIA
jgi:hypothetical protein